MSNSDQREGDEPSHFKWFWLGSAALPGLAALVALIFTSISVGQAKQQLKITEQGQLTDRFNSAIENLGSRSLDIRLGGIYALQQIMRDSARDQPTVISVLSAFVRQHTHITAKEAEKRYSLLDEPNKHPAAADIQVAIDVLISRSPKNDGPTRVNLEQADLHGTTLLGSADSRASLQGSSLRGALLSGSNWDGVDLSGAYLLEARLNDVVMFECNLSRAVLARAQLKGSAINNSNISYGFLYGSQFNDAQLLGVNLSHSGLVGSKFNNVKLADSNLSDANLSRSNLNNANLVDVDLRRASLNGADLRKARLTRVNLRGADLSEADLRGAVFKEADLHGAKLDGAKTDGAVGLPPHAPATEPAQRHP